MIFLTEAVSALNGSFLLAMRRADGFERFNLTAEGFWRSFAAVIVIAPLYLYADRVNTLYPDPGAAPADFNPALSLITLAVEWIAWPVAVALLTYKTRFSGHFVRYITVYNWSSIPVFVVMMVPVVALDMGLIDTAQAAAAGAVLLIVALWYRWQVARMALEVPGLVAVGLVAGDVGLSLLISRLISG